MVGGILRSSGPRGKLKGLQRPPAIFYAHKPMTLYTGLLLDRRGVLKVSGRCGPGMSAGWGLVCGWPLGYGTLNTLEDRHWDPSSEARHHQQPPPPSRRVSGSLGLGEMSSQRTEKTVTNSRVP